MTRSIGGVLTPDALAALYGRDRHRTVDLAELRRLLERVAFDLEHGWPEAAQDALSRALRLLADEGAP